MASSILLERSSNYCDIQRHIIPFTDYSIWERKKSSNNRRYSAATRSPTRSKTPSKGQSKSAISAKDYLLKVTVGFDINVLNQMFAMRKYHGNITQFLVNAHYLSVGTDNR